MNCFCQPAKFHRSNRPIMLQCGTSGHTIHFTSSGDLVGFDGTAILYLATAILAAILYFIIVRNQLPSLRYLQLDCQSLYILVYLYRGKFFVFSVNKIVQCNYVCAHFNFLQNCLYIYTLIDKLTGCQNIEETNKLRHTGQYFVFPISVQPLS